jgi:hypothetical protein
MSIFQLYHGVNKLQIGCDNYHVGQLYHGVNKLQIGCDNYHVVQLYHGVNKLQIGCDNYHVGLLINEHAYLDFYSACSLKQQSTDRHIALPGHIILIPS